MKYRREIDGLRAIAVLAVIFFHSGLKTFTGGFVGVDVFFVISGYLITTLILAEKANGKFNLLTFYERRTRRLMPALFVMLVVCLPFAWLLMLPADLDDFAQTLAGVSVFSSNIVLWLNSGYFSPDTEFMPLLHTWTLAVEEQFYWLFPLILLTAWRFKLKHLVPILVAVFLLSLGAAQWESIQAPSADFYLLPTRAWELLMGVLLAYYLAKQPTPTVSRPCAEILSMLGVIMISASIVWFNQNTPFPSVYALVPTVGAALIILAAQPKTFVGRLFGSKLLVAVGLVSYSAYLWHQPLFAFSRIYLGSQLSVSFAVCISVVSLVMAFISWKFVETPFRSREFLSRRGLFLIAIAGSLIFFGIGRYTHSHHGFVDRLTTAQRAIYEFASYKKDGPYRQGTCYLNLGQSEKDFKSECSGTPAKPELLVWGDSHAAALSSGMRGLVPGLAQYTTSACPPVLDVDFAKQANCRAINDYVLSRIKSLQPVLILLHANWLASYGPKAVDAQETTIHRIKEVAPLAKIILLGGVPRWEPQLPLILLKSHQTLEPNMKLISPFYAESKVADARLKSIANKYDIAFASAMDVFCDTKGCQIVTGEPGSLSLVTWDRSHLTQAGATVLAAHLEAEGLVPTPLK